MSKLILNYQSLIRKIKPMDDQEQKDKELVLNWLEKEKSIYREESQKEHLCAYFPLVNKEKTYMFLVHHIKSGLWLPTGGHVEKGETLEQTVIRELKEELGISLKHKPKPFFVGRITTVGKTPGHTHNDVWFLIKVNKKIKLNPNKKEFYRWGWFFFDQAVKKSSEPNLKRAVKKIKQF